jgi:hypothetical protein
MRLTYLPVICFLGLVPILAADEKPSLTPGGTPWKRHAIDDSSRGADGVRLADVNGDGLPDVATAWEEGGLVRVYLNPGPAKAKQKWPAVTAGKVVSPEDAVLADLDGDGTTDVVSCCEGKVKSVFVHWAPKDGGKYLDPAAWETAPFPAVRDRCAWMFCLPLQIDGRHGIDLVVGGKDGGAQVGWLQAPADARDLAAWKYHPLCDAGWVMELRAADVNGDGRTDILASDRKGPRRGCLWLEDPGPGESQAKPWKEHRIGPAGDAVMFLDLADLDRDGLSDVVVPLSGRELLFHRRTSARPVAWEQHRLPFPERTGGGKAVRAGDLDGDGKPDIVLSCEGAGGTNSGVVWMSYSKSPTDGAWEVHEISGTEGVKYDRIELADLDGDGDLDVMTTEEKERLGVVWYENPTRHGR